VPPCAFRPLSHREKKGYLEDRRPNANIDPYVVSAIMVETICGAAKPSASKKTVKKAVKKAPAKKATVKKLAKKAPAKKAAKKR